MRLVRFAFTFHVRVPRGWALAAFAWTAAAACGRRVGPVDISPPDPPPVRAGGCGQPGGEFAAAGCAALRVRVVDSQGRPLRGVGVSVSPDSRCGCNAPGGTTDSLGVVATTVYRFAAPRVAAAPDTVSAVVAAFTLQQSGTARQPATVRDSARVVLTMTPIGTTVSPTEVDLRLPAAP